MSCAAESPGFDPPNICVFLLSLFSAFFEFPQFQEVSESVAKEIFAATQSAPP
jgi:hypothetical protein